MYFLPVLPFILLSAGTLAAPTAEPANITAIEERGILLPRDGINCRGSGLCDKFLNGAVVGNDADSLTWFIRGIDQNRMYQNGEQIACFGPSRICAFLQSTPSGASGATIRNLAHHINEHDCKVCGSVPLGFPDSNDNSKGELTYNYVRDTQCGMGLC